MKCATCRKDEAIDTWWEKIRFWFFSRFHQDILDLAQEKYTMGFGDGYKKAFELKYDMENRTGEAINKLEGKLDQALRPLIHPYKFEAVDPTKVIEAVRLPNGVVIMKIEDKPISDLEKEQLVAEADYFTRSNLWRIMKETVKNKAVEKGIENSKTWEETLSAKMMVHNLGIMESIINRILSKTK